MWENSSHYRCIYRNESSFISQNNFKYLAEINVLVSIIIKISRECNSNNESQIHNICENIFQGNALRHLYSFQRTPDGFSKGNIKFSMHIHALKINNKNVKAYDICSKLIIKKLERIWAAKS